jgi:hypothetical protein
MGRQQQQLCMVFLMAFLVVSTMDVVHVAAGRCTTPATNTLASKVLRRNDSFVKLHACLSCCYRMTRMCRESANWLLVRTGRALGEVSYGALIPGGAPSVPRGQPYTGRPCTRIYACRPPAAAAVAGAGGAP